MKSSLICALGLALAAPSIASANLLLNGDFETGGPGQLGTAHPSWSNWGNAGWHHADPGEFLGTKAMMFWWDDAGVWQDVAVPPGGELQYGLSALNSSADRATWNLLVRLEFYETAGGPLLLEDRFKFTAANLPVDQWVHLTDTVTAPQNAAVARMVINMTDWFDGVGGTWNYDNAFITPVPEPASLSLLGIGALALFRRRRNR